MSPTHWILFGAVLWVVGSVVLGLMLGHCLTRLEGDLPKCRRKHGWSGGTCSCPLGTCSLVPVELDS